jgi:hypothetical protein
MTAATTRTTSNNDVILARIEHQIALLKQELDQCKVLQEAGNQLTRERILSQDQQHLEHIAALKKELDLRLGPIEASVKTMAEELQAVRDVTTQFKFVVGIGGGGGLIGIFVGIVALFKAIGG